MLHSMMFWFVCEMVCIALALIGMVVDSAEGLDCHSSKFTTIALLGAIISWLGLLLLG